MLDAARSSEFVRAHEFVGSSVLLVADARGQADVFWIDFAKTKVLPPGAVVTHCTSWTLGNHEDGVFTGMSNLRDLTTYTQVRLNSSSPADNGASHFGLAARVKKMTNIRSKSQSLSDVALLGSLPAFSAIQHPQHLVAPILRVGAAGASAAELIVNASAGAVVGAGAAVVNAAAVGATTAGAAAVDVATNAVTVVMEPVARSKRFSLPRRSCLWTCGGVDRTTDSTGFPSPTRSAMIAW